MINSEMTIQGQKARRFIIKFAWLMAGGMFIDGFVLGYIGALMPSITADLQLSTTWQGLIGAASLIGIFFGSPIGGYLADRFGRKPMFTFDLFIFLVCSIGQFFTSDPYTLFIIRLFMGIAIGIEYAVGWPMLAEFAPARIRGKLLALTETSWFVGYLASYTISFIMIEQHIGNWNIILGLSAIPSLIVLVLRLGMPESPRWLMSKGRKAEATKIAQEYLSEEDQQDVLNQRHENIGKTSGFSDLFKAKNIKGTILLSMYFFGMAVPYYALGTFIPMVLEKLGMHNGIAGGLFLNTFAVFGTIAAVILIERISRRNVALMPFVLSTIALVVVALSEDSPTLIIIGFLVYAFVSAAAAAVLSVIPGEVLRPEVSGLGTGFATAFSRVGAAIGVFWMPQLIAEHGAITAVWLAAGICLITTVVTYLFMPETKGKTMSEIFH
ncbi:MFS transporter [Acinetobacter baumannii]|uniref:MFS transporter n=1 Tax=Acinetobacter baumannii TaxID=470 RepID=UPI0019D14F2C|nr:MFS transporter [Acinetobacter baumannii]HBY7915423.1 MFS transporter [Acinetobacter baumannii]HBY9044322.1 MFS transporter [Acinetobacter baumannii]HDZ1844335.1 MFS transporter [Acinetobacter baumannii]